MSLLADAVTFTDAQNTSWLVTSLGAGRKPVVNCSGQLYSMSRDEKRALHMFAHVVFYVSLSLGIPGNLLSACVWLRTSITRHNSSAVYLGALAVADLVFLALYFVTRVCLKLVDTRHWPKLFFIVLSNSRRAAEMLEPLIVAAFSLERLIAIARPLQALRVCTVGRSKKTVVVLATVAVLVPISQTLIDYVYHGKVHRGVTLTRWITIFVFFVVLPLMTLVFNIAVIHHARRASNNSDAIGRQSTLNTNSAVPTTMLLAVSLLYVILSSSSTLSYLLTRFLPRSKHEVPAWCVKALRPRLRLSDRVYSVTSQLHKLVFVYNFFVYVATGRQFRAELRQTFGCRVGVVRKCFASQHSSQQSDETAV